MIANPDKYFDSLERPNSSVRAHFNKTDEPYFYCGSRYGMMTVGLVKQLGVAHWYISRFQGGKEDLYVVPISYNDDMMISHGTQSKDEFWAIMESDYPDYLEWLLWNPDWYIAYR